MEQQCCLVEFNAKEYIDTTYFGRFAALQDLDNRKRLLKHLSPFTMTQSEVIKYAERYELKNPSAKDLLTFAN